MVQIEFSLRVAQKAMEAINDNRFLRKNIEETSTNTIEFDEEFLEEILYHLYLWGISEDEFDLFEIK